MTTRGYDIRASDVYTKQMEKEFGVRMTKEDLAFYEDNCKGSYSARCSNTVPRAWLNQKRRNDEREQSANKKRIILELENNMRQVSITKVDDSYVEDMDTAGKANFYA